MQILGFTKMVIDPKQADSFAELVKANMADTHEVSGNTDYTFFRDLLDSGTFYSFEKWESEEALGAHMASPHMAKFWEAMGGFDIDVTPQKFEVSDGACD